MLKFHKLIQKLNNVILQKKEKKEFILFPPISIAPYLYVRDNNLAFIPYSYFIFIRRINLSNPLDFRLFINDVLLAYDKIAKLFKDKYEFIFIFDPELFYEELVSYIPAIVIPRDYPIPRDAMTLSLEVKNNMTICYVEGLFKILIPSLTNVVNTINNSNSSIRINCEPHNICNPLICLLHQNESNKDISFDHIDQLLSFINRDQEKRKYVIIEIWSSISPVKLFHKISQSYYIWSPMHHRQYVKALEEFITSIEISYIKTCYIISPKSALAEYGSINDGRIWLSSLLSPIIHKVKKFHTYIF